MPESNKKQVNKELKQEKKTQKNASNSKKTIKKNLKTTTPKKATAKVSPIKQKNNIAYKINELSVIEKIKEFIAKIAVMQEEASKELNEKEQKESKKRKEIKTTKSGKVKVDYTLEYYDLPYRYNETVVKILAQTPKKLFVYWDIADSDKEKYIKTFGEKFFENTYPVLLLYNEQKRCIKEIPVNDFANSWYLEVPDSKTKYTIQLGRKFKYSNSTIDYGKVRENNIILKTDYLPFANSNELEVPNDHVLLERLPKFITFRNVKTNQEVVKELKSFKDVFGNNYNVNEFYQSEYKEEVSEGMFDMANPSSKLSSSFFK